MTPEPSTPDSGGPPAGWAIVENRLRRDLEFSDFAEAFAFMTRVAEIAEEMDHHPDWSNSWNRVTIDIASHDAGGITARCIELAQRVSTAAGPWAGLGE